ncbi:cytochrome P450 711A1-like [Ananas comosus]|uniref:Cytochrome P450 711A1-like n=1 Tax=Ananas comosus TaxID=4615 RepID=A0A6P5EB66_ANACO|nr:cytochrome P450 711A1-like [Ananas comosus]
MDLLRGWLSGWENTEMNLVRGCAPPLLSSVILLVAFLVYFYLPYWRVRAVPGPPATFLVGHLPALAKYGPDILRVFAKEYGPIFRFHMGRQPLVIVADAELCKEVGIKKFKDIKNRSSPPPTVGSPLHQDALFLTRYSLQNTSNKLLNIYFLKNSNAACAPTTLYVCYIPVDKSVLGL